MKKNGFTLIEIIVVVMIVIILSSAAIGGASSIMRNLRFNNTINSMVFSVQNARSLAASGKDTQTTKSYVVIFDISTNPQKFRLITLPSTIVTDTGTTTETTTLATSNNMTLSAVYDGAACNGNARIQFINGTGDAKLYCSPVANADPVAAQYLTITLQNTQAGLTKSFSIHQAAGIPQLN